jgi:hypothetical protein
MSEETAPAVTEQTPVAADPQTGVEEPQTGAPTGAVEAPVDLAVLQSDLIHAKAQAAQFKAELKAARAVKESEVEAAKSEAQRLAELEAEKAAWQTERQQMYVGFAVRDLAPKYGLIDPEAVVRLMDWSALDFDEKGKPVNAEDAVRVLLRDKPYLGGVRPQAPVATNATEGTTPARPPNLTADELEAAAASGISIERYAALKGVKTIEDWQATRRSQGQT